MLVVCYSVFSGALMKTNKELVDELRTTPERWMDAAIVVAFEDRFEFVGEDHPDPVRRLTYLLEQGGLPIGFAGLVPVASPGTNTLQTQVFSEYVDQAWAHRYMSTLRGMVRKHSSYK